MHRSSEVILRNAHRLAKGGVLLINPPPDRLAWKLSDKERSVHCFSQHHGDFRWLCDNGIHAEFGLLPVPGADVGTAVLHLPREKELLNLLLHALSSAVQPDARVWLVGENKAGIKSSPRHLQRYFGSVEKLDSARHCGLFEARQPRPPGPFILSDYQQQWATAYGGKEIRVASLPGVFAHGRLDPGSRLLLQALESLPLQGDILDFACGSGVLASCVLSRFPGTHLALADVSAIALEASRRTLALNHQQAECFPSDGLAQLRSHYDWIISNPPFHRGIHNDLNIAAGFFLRAGTFLNEKGRIVIVCNRHLPYASGLRNHFRCVEELASDEQFKVLAASTPLNG